jgi:hypothetical protein
MHRTAYRSADVAVDHPDCLDALIVQNAVAHEDGLGPLWQTGRDFWADRPAHEAALRENFFSFAATRQRHLGTSPNVENYDPDLWTDEFAFLSRPGQHDIQTDLFYDYRTNVASCPAWQDWLRQHRPRCWSSGAGMTRRSRSPRPTPTAGTCPTLRCTSSTPATSPSTSSPRQSRT